ncbi:MAG: hypothetical protein ACOYL6_15860 [Bacteriovoracaceae bacterium]
MKQLILGLLVLLTSTAHAMVCVDTGNFEHNKPSLKITDMIAKQLRLKHPDNIHANGVISTGGEGFVTYINNYLDKNSKYVDITVTYKFDENCENITDVSTAVNSAKTRL